MPGYRQYHSRVALPCVGTPGAVDFDPAVNFDYERRNLVVTVVSDAMVTCLHSCAPALSHPNPIGPDAFPLWYQQGKSC